MSIDNITTQLNSIIESEIVSRDVSSEWKEKYEYLLYEIDENLRKAQLLYDDMKQNGLTFGAIEAEGFLRCAVTLKNLTSYI